MWVVCSSFVPPDGAGPEFVREAYEAMIAVQEVQPTFRKRPAKILGGITDLAWSFDDDIDLDYHLRRSAVPSPGRVRELLELTSRLHGSLLDRHRPLWEAHLVEGLNDRTVRGVRQVSSRADRRRLGTEADAAGADCRSLRHRNESAVGPATQHRDRKSQNRSRSPGLARLEASVAALARQSSWPVPLCLNSNWHCPSWRRVPCSTFPSAGRGGALRNRRRWTALEKVKSAAGVTVNDVVLAMCAGALRAYLIEQSKLPSTPLIAMVPVNLRTERDADGGGNIVGTVLCNLRHQPRRCGPTPRGDQHIDA